MPHPEARGVTPILGHTINLCLPKLRIVTAERSNRRKRERKASSWRVVTPGQCARPLSTGGSGRNGQMWLQTIALCTLLT